MNSSLPNGGFKLNSGNAQNSGLGSNTLKLNMGNNSTNQGMNFGRSNTSYGN